MLHEGRNTAEVSSNVGGVPPLRRTVENVTSFMHSHRSKQRFRGHSIDYSGSILDEPFEKRSRRPTA